MNSKSYYPLFFALILIVPITLSNFLSLVFVSLFDSAFGLMYVKYLALIFSPFGIYKLTTVFFVLQKSKSQLVLLYLIIVLPYLIYKYTGLGNALGNLQFLLTFPLLILSGVGVGLFVKNFKLFFTKLNGLLLNLFLLFGFFEWMLGEIFWDNFSLKNYYFYIGFGDAWNLEYDLPRNWVSWDLLGILGGGVERMVSVFIEPVGWGRYVAVSLIIGFIFNDKLVKNPITIVFAIAAILLTISKGGVVLVLIYLVGVILKPKLQIILVISSYTLVIFLIGIGYGGILGPSIVNHGSSVIYAFQILLDYPIGQGIYIDHVNEIYDLVEQDNDNFTVRSEGSLALYSIMCGVAGMLMYFILFYITFPKSKISDVYCIELLCFSILLSSIAAHSAVSIIGSGIPFILFGYNIYHNLRK